MAQGLRGRSHASRSRAPRCLSPMRHYRHGTRSTLRAKSCRRCCGRASKSSCSRPRLRRDPPPEAHLDACRPWRCRSGQRLGLGCGRKVWRWNRPDSSGCCAARHPSPYRTDAARTRTTRKTWRRRLPRRLWLSLVSPFRWKWRQQCKRHSRGPGHACRLGQPAFAATVSPMRKKSAATFPLVPGATLHFCNQRVPAGKREPRRIYLVTWPAQCGSL